MKTTFYDLRLDTQLLVTEYLKPVQLFDLPTLQSRIDKVIYLSLQEVILHKKSEGKTGRVTAMTFAELHVQFEGHRTIYSRLTATVVPFFNRFEVGHILEYEDDFEKCHRLSKIVGRKNEIQTYLRAAVIKYVEGCVQIPSEITMFLEYGAKPSDDTFILALPGLLEKPHIELITLLLEARVPGESVCDHILSELDPPVWKVLLPLFAKYGAKPSSVALMVAYLKHPGVLDAKALFSNKANLAALGAWFLKLENLGMWATRFRSFKAQFPQEAISVANGLLSIALMKNNCAVGIPLVEQMGIKPTLGHYQHALQIYRPQRPGQFPEIQVAEKVIQAYRPHHAAMRD